MVPPADEGFGVASRMSPSGAVQRNDWIKLDHVGHFIADVDGAHAALVHSGFSPTPFSAHTAPTGPDGRLEATGTGNICAMLGQGYIEALASTADTPLGRELESAIAQRIGVHLIAFAVADAARAHARLGREGFETRPLVRMKRPVDTENGPSVARFTVARLKAGAMPEGRIQIVTHHSEAEVWQPRWLKHPNGAVELLGVVIVSDAPLEVAERFSRFLGRTADSAGEDFFRIELDRGHIVICGARSGGELFEEIPKLPWLAAYGIRVEGLEGTRALLSRAGFDLRVNGRAIVARFPPALGSGFWVFAEDRQDLPWLHQSSAKRRRRTRIGGA